MAGHLKIQALQLVAESLGTSHRFVVANSAWTDGTVECMMRELVCTLKALLSEGPLVGWVLVMPVIQ